MELTMTQHDHIQKICEWWFAGADLKEKYEVIEDKLLDILREYDVDDLEEDSSNSFYEDLEQFGVLKDIVKVLNDHNFK